jgi:hypothetical protein
MKPDARFAVTVETDLRNLLHAEEIYFSEHVTYSASLEDLKFRPSSGVTITIQNADDSSWRAVATHLQSPHWVCDMAVGGPAREEGSHAQPHWRHE